MASSYQIGRVFGIPIRVHVTLLILLPLMALDISQDLGGRSFLWGIAAAVGLFACVALHELGHSLVALRKGCRAREILLLPIGGIAQMDRMPEKPRDEFQVAIAGPAVSLALGFLGLFLRDLLAGAQMVKPALVAHMLGRVNIMLAVFNLLPSFPMDGGRVFRAWLTPHLGRVLATGIAAKTGRFLAIAFGVYGFFTFNIFLIVIALFIYQAAGAEYRMVRIQEAARQTVYPSWGPAEKAWPYEEGEVEVSPPPYRRGRASSVFVRPLRAQHDLFDDLFEKWR
jgi:Zn-dependent protease